MRALVLAAALLVLAMPAVDASCHFCVDDVERDCGSSDPTPEACAESVTYMATHYVQHVLNDDP